MPTVRQAGGTARRGRRAAMALLLAAGCADQVFEPVQNNLVRTATLSGRVRVTTKADLLFVVDDSPAMENEQQKLAAGFPALRQALDALDPPVDWRVGVLTMSVDERFSPCNAIDPGAPAQCSADFGGTGFACEAGQCVRRFPDAAGRLFSAPGTPAVLERGALSAADFEAAFARNARPGTSGSRQDQPLRALTQAFQGGLDGFWRDDARLVVVLAGDADDCSDSRGRVAARTLGAQGLEDGCAKESAAGSPNLDPVSEWTRAFRALRAGGETRETAIAAFTGLEPGTQNPGLCSDDACTAACAAPPALADCAQSCQGALRPELCRDQCVAQCRAFCGAQAPGTRIAQAVRELGGQLSSVCSPGYGPALSALAQVVGIPTRIALPSLPRDPRTVVFRVTRGGKATVCRDGPDYTLDLVSDPPALVIDQAGPCRLLPGDEWSLEFVAK